MNTVFDFGMYDGEDARYYLESGYKVVAVEANPALCAMVAKRLAQYVNAGHLVIENVAVSNQPGTIDLHISGQDLGSSSVVAERLEDRFPLGKYSVPTVTYDDLAKRHGKPTFLKIDIEGADKECVLSLKHETAPPYLSFEAHTDLEVMVDHCYSAGYRSFKIIHQNSFRCIQKQDSLRERLRMKVVRLAGYDKPLVTKIEGRYHVLGHSAGPAPWHSDGRWHDRSRILDDWRNTRRRGWYDVHAKTRAAEPVPRASAERAGLWWWAGKD
jgi:FkbM family methyltransferase